MMIEVQNGQQQANVTAGKKFPAIVIPPLRRHGSRTSISVGHPETLSMASVGAPAIDAYTTRSETQKTSNPIDSHSRQVNAIRASCDLTRKLVPSIQDRECGRING